MASRHLSRIVRTLKVNSGSGPLRKLVYCLAPCPENNHYRPVTVININKNSENEHLATVKFNSMFSFHEEKEKELNFKVPLKHLPVVSMPVSEHEEVQIKHGSRGKLVIGVSALAGMVLTPVAVPVVVSALGFGALGIGAGTAAASIMASYGGAVTTGSACAVMQSIGAAGLGTTGILVSGAVGGTVTGSASFVAEKFKKIIKR